MSLAKRSKGRTQWNRMLACPVCDEPLPKNKPSTVNAHIFSGPCADEINAFLEARIYG